MNRDVGTYTSSVNSRKFIHALLVLALCYGQLVASVHVVGHMHSHDCELASHSFSDDCGASHHQVAGNTDLAHHHDGEATDTGNHSENDCAIYHALLSLSGVFDLARNSVPVPLPQRTSKSAAVSSIATAVLKQQQIRAPPAIV